MSDPLRIVLLEQAFEQEVREMQVDITCGDRSIDSLVAAAVHAGASPSLAEEAGRITTRRFRVPGTAATVSERAAAYFWGVVRRRALSGGAPALVSGMVAASLAAELVEAGHAPDVVRREVERICGVRWAGVALPIPVRAA